MVRGLFAGLGTGGVVAVLGLGALSVLAPLPQDAPAPQASGAGATEQPGPLAVVEPEAAPVPAAPPAVSAPVAPVAESPQTPPAALPADPAPAADPAPGMETVHEAPPRPAEPMPVPPAGDAPMDIVTVPAGSEFLRGAGDEAPAAPRAESGTGLPGARPPIAPVVPAPVETSVAVAAAETRSAARPEAATLPDMPVAPVPGVEDTATPAAETPVPVPPPGSVVAPGLAPAIGPGTMVGVPGGEILLLPDSAPANRVLGPRIFSAGQGNAPGTVVNRLPTVGGSGGEAPATEAPVTEVPAYRRFAAAAPPPGEAAALAVILLDDGTVQPGAAGIALTVAIDPLGPDAGARATAWRAAGAEVAILAVGLPPEASPQDIEVTLEAWRTALPEAVAVVEDAEPAFQNSRAMSQAMVAALSREGLALVTRHGAGVNLAGQIARTAQLPEAAIWREIGTQDRAEAGRELDRALLEAARTRGVAVMLKGAGALAALSALPGDRAAAVPVSAVFSEN